MSEPTNTQDKERPNWLLSAAEPEDLSRPSANGKGSSANGKAAEDHQKQVSEESAPGNAHPAKAGAATQQQSGTTVMRGRGPLYSEESVQNEKQRSNPEQSITGTGGERVAGAPPAGNERGEQEEETGELPTVSPLTRGQERVGMMGRLAAAHPVMLVCAGAFLFVALIAFVVFEATGMGHSGGSKSSRPGSASAAAPIKNSHISFSGLSTKNGKAYLTGAGLSWQGEVKSGDHGKTITLQGPTAAEFKTGFDLPGASIYRGEYAVAQPNGPVVHVETQTYYSRSKEITQASIFAYQNGRLTASGFYRDEREAGSDRVIRTYMDPGGHNYRVSYQAPPNTPIPLLIGWQGPGSGHGGGGGS